LGNERLSEPRDTSKIEPVFFDNRGAAV